MCVHGVCVHGVCVHDVCVHGVCVHDVCVHDVCVHDVCVHGVCVCAWCVCVHGVCVHGVCVHEGGYASLAKAILLHKTGRVWVRLGVCTQDLVRRYSHDDVADDGELDESVHQSHLPILDVHDLGRVVLNYGRHHRPKHGRTSVPAATARHDLLYNKLRQIIDNRVLSMGRLSRQDVLWAWLP